MILDRATGPPLDPWYVTGLIEGRASFTYSRGRSTGQVNVVFAMREGPPDLVLLESVRAFFDGAGRIYPVRPREPAVDACFYRVTRPIELLRIVAHLDGHPLRGSKKDAYGIWREMTLLRAAHTGEAPPEELNRLTRFLSERSGARRKRGR